MAAGLQLGYSIPVLTHAVAAGLMAICKSSASAVQSVAVATCVLAGRAGAGAGQGRACGNAAMCVAAAHAALRVCAREGAAAAERATRADAAVDDARGALAGTRELHAEEAAAAQQRLCNMLRGWASPEGAPQDSAPSPASALKRISDRQQREALATQTELVGMAKRHQAVRGSCGAALGAAA